MLIGESYTVFGPRLLSLMNKGRKSVTIVVRRRSTCAKV